MDPAAPAPAPGAETYEEAQHILNTEGMPGFERLADDVHRRFDGHDAAAHPVLRRRGCSLHHAVIEARSLPWYLQHALIDILVRRGLDLNVMDRDGHTPLHRFIEGRRERDYYIDRATAWSVRHLIGMGARVVARPDEAPWPSFAFLAYHVGPQTLRLFMEMGAGSRSANQASG